MAGLYFRGETPAMLGGTFAREGRLVGKRALRHMRRVSKLVMETSRDYAPVDWKGYTSKHPPGHELERSHRIEEQYGDMGRLEASIVVGGMVGDVDVDRYVTWMHEGPYNLGKASQAKQAASGKMVGERFLERALEDNVDEFEPLLEELMEGLMS